MGVANSFRLEELTDGVLTKEVLTKVFKQMSNQSFFTPDAFNIIGPNGDVIETVIDDGHNCGWAPPCGGCARCLIAQAEHAGLMVEKERSTAILLHWNSSD